VCAYVVDNKEQHQAYLCRQLSLPSEQRVCVRVLESLMWWITNEVYWLNYGCLWKTASATEWKRPCPSRVVCGWIEDLYARKPFCNANPEFPRPT